MAIFPQEVDDVAIFAAVTHNFNVNKLFVRASPTCSHFFFTMQPANSYPSHHKLETHPKFLPQACNEAVYQIRAMLRCAAFPDIPKDTQMDRP